MRKLTAKEIDMCLAYCYLGGDGGERVRLVLIEHLCDCSVSVPEWGAFERIGNFCGGETLDKLPDTF